MANKDKYSQITTEELSRKRDELNKRIEIERKFVLDKIDQVERLCIEALELEVIINERRQSENKSTS